MNQETVENQQNSLESMVVAKEKLRLVGDNSDQRLPDDPRCWSRDDVAHWIKNMALLHSLPFIPTDRFLMNGKALCLMNMDMFVQRVPLGGKLLYKDFQIRLHQAMHRSQ